jgi:hypothetical protein
MIKLIALVTAVFLSAPSYAFGLSDLQQTIDSAKSRAVEISNATAEAGVEITKFSAKKSAQMAWAANLTEKEFLIAKKRLEAKLPNACSKAEKDRVLRVAIRDGAIAGTFVGGAVFALTPVVAGTATSLSVIGSGALGTGVGAVTAAYINTLSKSASLSETCVYALRKSFVI